MKAIEKILVTIGFLLLVAAAASKLFSKPHFTMGVRLISLIILSNTAFLLAILFKLCSSCDKK